MRPFAIIVLGVIAGVAAACGLLQETIPAGAQQVQVVVTESEVRLSPSTVRAGDIYLVLDMAPEDGFDFVQRQRTAEETPGPLTDADVARLARGDLGGFAFDGHGGGCTAEERAEARGRVGRCGAYGPVPVHAGKYAFTIMSPDGVTPRSVTILEVLP